MRPLEPLVKPAGLMAFDFDGTLVWPEDEDPVAAEFFDLLRWCREEHGLLWGIATGRSLPHLREGLAWARFPFVPDFAVTREREVFFINAFGRWEQDGRWNKSCESQTHRLFKKARKVLARVKVLVEEELHGTWVEQEGDLAGVVVNSEEELDWLLEEAAPELATLPKLCWERNGIYLRFGHAAFRKGGAVQRVCERWKFTAEQVLTAGDNYNDLSMLDPAVAGRLVCPGNAVGAVKEQVASHQGVVSDKIASRGMIDGLKKLWL